MSQDDSINASRRQFMGAVPLAGAAAALGLSSQAHANPLAPARKNAATGSAGSRLRKIGLEEHFMIPEFVTYLEDTKQNIRPDLFGKALPALSDFGDRRLEIMDKNGIDYVVLSLSGPGVQVEKNTAYANKLARLCNDRLAEQVHKRPQRYGGFAHLALQDPAEAANELERCMTQLGFKGALINGATNGVYLDDPAYDVFWERVQALKAPIYIHPANPFDHPAMYEGHPELWGPTWSWAVETCTHFMRLMFSGVFDRFPDVAIILGHMGETLPIQTWRLDSRYAISNHRHEIKLAPSEYIRRNLYLTTSGVCSDSALRCALDSVGEDKVMFSIDYPFESTKVASEWIDKAAVSANEREGIAWRNATRLMRL